MNQIDAILYINLAHRIDRNEHILKEIHKICEDDNKIHRIDAIKKNPGILGCAYSHIKALEYALDHPEWNTILILEDDFTFHSEFPIEIKTSLDIFLNYCDNYDVALLSFNNKKIRYNNTRFSFMKRVIYSQTASSYIIKKEYIMTLIRNMMEGVEDTLKNGPNHENAIDIYWTKLMPIGKWYTIFPALGYQYENYSDIENKCVNYKC